MTNVTGTALTLRRARLAALPLVFAALGACAGTNLPSISVQASNQGLTEGYGIAAGDKIKVTVFDEENLTGEYEVGMDGALQMPLVGSVPAMDETANGLAGKIAAKLQEGGYVLVPKVSVELLDHRPFYILGEVNKPGEYEHQAGMTLEQAIAKAGGYTRRADTGAVVLKRNDWQSSMRVRLDGKSLKIAPGDTITVSEAFF